MTRLDHPRRTADQAGFTLIELLVVVLIIGILAAIAVPQYFKVVEKGRFAESTSCFSVIKGSQERYLLKNNTYATAATSLDTDCPGGRYFGAVALSGVAASSYLAALTRGAPLPTAYGAYVVTFQGPAGTYTCNNATCTTDLLP